MKKKIILWLLLLAGVAFIFWKLRDNKRTLAAEAKLSKVVRAHVPVEVTNPTLETLSNELEADGIFMPFKEMFVISETAGRVLEVHKNKGEWVNEGELLAKVDDEMLRIELEATEANLTKMLKDKERLGNLIAGEAAPKNKIEDIELGILAAESKKKGLQKQINNTSIKAPMSGTLGLRFIERGSVIGPGIQVAQITNLQRLTLYVKVTERDILSVRKGQNVRVEADVFQGQNFTGRVVNIGLKADNTFNYDVEIEVANPKLALRGGMHARATFVFDEKRKGLTLPRKAIVGSLREGSVFVVDDSIAVEKKVSVGGVHGEKVEVRSGLSERDEVVVSGQMNLKNGTRVAVLRN